MLVNIVLSALTNEIARFLLLEHSSKIYAAKDERNSARAYLIFEKKLSQRDSSSESVLVNIAISALTNEIAHFLRLGKTHSSKSFSPKFVNPDTRY